MGARSKIEWTDATWNPIRGCSRVSEGCRHCYAERMAARFSKPGEPYDGLITDNHWNGKLILAEEHLEDPLRWKKPRRVFVNSMSDLFHENVPDEWIYRVLAIIALKPEHTFQILTKRPERMLSYMSTIDLRDRISTTMDQPTWLQLPKGRTFPRYPETWPLQNLWLGVSVENQKTADVRIPQLLQTPAALRFVSCEPLLGPVDLCNLTLANRSFADALSGVDGAQTPPLHSTSAPSIRWVIAGGESGPSARPAHPDWMRSIRDQCRNSSVPFFFKQWGTWSPHGSCTAPRRVVCSATGELLPPELTESYLEKHDGPRCAGNHQIMFRYIQPCDCRRLDDREWSEVPEVTP